MLRPRTVLAAQIVTLVAAGAIAYASLVDPDLALTILALSYVALGLLAIGAVWLHLRSPPTALRCRACGSPREHFHSLPFCHACGTHVAHAAGRA